MKSSHGVYKPQGTDASFSYTFWWYSSGGAIRWEAEVRRVGMERKWRLTGAVPAGERTVAEAETRVRDELHGAISRRCGEFSAE